MPPVAPCQLAATAHATSLNGVLHGRAQHCEHRPARPWPAFAPSLSPVHPCDKRRATSHYKRCFPAVDFSLVTEEHDVLWQLEYRETKEEIAARGLAFIRWLMTRPERSIAVVTHSSLLHFMLQVRCFLHGRMASRQPLQLLYHGRGGGMLRGAIVSC